MLTLLAALCCLGLILLLLLHHVLSCCFQVGARIRIIRAQPQRSFKVGQGSCVLAAVGGGGPSGHKCVGVGGVELEGFGVALERLLHVACLWFVFEVGA